jgi:UDP-N-acetylglucosamine diphosphorylase / glucose-1-phosphate thymidylyltransferase / UDP-N-acetylgalactosamine diphosphorylase / glucosamine-1-phosphate N-acetyltransferase / galactosamine-1-phosphate N-acetyltransferase
MTYPADRFFSNRNFHPLLFSEHSNVWEVIAKVGEYLRSKFGSENRIEGEVHPSAILVGNGIVIEGGAHVDAGALIKGPVLIERNAFIGHGAMVRPNVLVGADCMIGHCSEIKDSILFPRSSAAHFNFVGDSIVGEGVNLGGGTIISNFEFSSNRDQLQEIIISTPSAKIATGRTKLGALVGDGVKTGSNSVLSPGSLVEPFATVFSGVCVRKGLVPKGTSVKADYYSLMNKEARN